MKSILSPFKYYYHVFSIHNIISYYYHPYHWFPTFIPSHSLQLFRFHSSPLLTFPFFATYFRYSPSSTLFYGFHNNKVASWHQSNPIPKMLSLIREYHKKFLFLKFNIYTYHSPHEHINNNIDISVPINFDIRDRCIFPKSTKPYFPLVFFFSLLIIKCVLDEKRNKILWWWITDWNQHHAVEHHKLLFALISVVEHPKNPELMVMS